MLIASLRKYALHHISPSSPEMQMKFVYDEPSSEMPFASKELGLDFHACNQTYCSYISRFWSI